MHMKRGGRYLEFHNSRRLLARLTVACLQPYMSTRGRLSDLTWQ